MPKVIGMKATTEVLEGGVTDEVIPVADYEQFKSSLWVDYEGLLVWEPRFPFSSTTYYSTTFSEEALSRSNYRVIRDDFDDASAEYQEWNNNDVRFNAGDTVGIARAAMWEDAMDGYPVASDDDYSELEMELVEEAYNDYGKDEVIEWLQENDNPLGLLDSEGEPIDELDHYLLHLFEGCYSYNGEGYVDDSAMEYAMRDVRYEMRAEFERVQPPLVEEENQ